MTPSLRFMAQAMSIFLASSLSNGFQVKIQQHCRLRPYGGHSICLASSSDQQTEFVVSLEKPLGIILEEKAEGAAMGVVVAALGDEGSAIASEFKDALVGSQLLSVMDQDVSNSSFDDVMSAIIDAPSVVTMKFQTASDFRLSEPESQFPVGTKVVITVIDGDSEKVLEGKVGENLRSTLLRNNIEIYKGLKQKLGNCGGAGQCTFCAVELLSSEGWEERTEYEQGKLKKNQNARLSCLNNIQGPATIRLTSY